MKYVAIDVETTGLDRKNGQILEFAAVFADLADSKTPISALPIFHTYVTHPEYKVEPYAAWMNATAFERIGKQIAGWNYTRIEDLARAFHIWIREMGGGLDDNILCSSKGGKFTLVVAGKNYSAFDAHFIERIPKWDDYFKPHHRTIDPAALFLQVGDLAPPDLSTCLKRAGLPSEVKHQAAADAFDVISLIRSKYAGTIDNELETSNS